MKISEFRLAGPGAVTPTLTDEFVELYNESSAPVTVSTTDGSAGWALAASDGVTRFTVPNGTVIPAHGHFLGANSAGYSLGTYPGGVTTALANATWTTDIPNNTGMALFNTSNPLNYTLANRLDAVGFVGTAALYKEGAGIPNITDFNSANYGIFRLVTASGDPKDTGDNAADFIHAEPNGISQGFGQHLGVPAPENLAAPRSIDGLSVSLLDPSVSSQAPPNLVRDPTPDAVNNSTFGTIDIRRRITNVSGAPLTRLRLRITELTTFPAPSGIADLRLRNSSDVAVALPGETTTARGTTVEVPPNQPNGGGLNTSLSVPSVQIGTPIAAGASVDVHVLVGLQQTGGFRFCANLEGTSAGGAIAQTGLVAPGSAAPACTRAETLVPAISTPTPPVTAPSGPPAATHKIRCKKRKHKGKKHAATARCKHKKKKRG
jgi:hypothetical protein